MKANMEQRGKTTLQRLSQKPILMKGRNDLAVGQWGQQQNLERLSVKSTKSDSMSLLKNNQQETTEQPKRNRYIPIDYLIIAPIHCVEPPP